jgi:tRNA (cmo5U34)-methyltransferase
MPKIKPRTIAEYIDAAPKEGTGAEIVYLAQRFPQWRFTAVEPSAPMLEVCRLRAEEHGIASRCVFHEGYLDSLPPSEAFDAATSLLVSQFILEREARSDFFRTIAERLRPESHSCPVMTTGVAGGHDSHGT